MLAGNSDAEAGVFHAENGYFIVLFPYKLMSAVTHGCVVANSRQRFSRYSVMRVVSFNLFAFSD